MTGHSHTSPDTPSAALLALHARELNAPWHFLGSQLRVDIRAEELADGRYKIEKDEWDKTLGPIFAQAASVHKINLRREIDERVPVGILHGYTAMDAAQTRAFHTLVQSFAAAEDPQNMAHFSGDYRTRIEEFAAAHASGHIIADRAQLDGLTAMARAGAQFAITDTQYDHIDAFWKAHIHDNPRMDYRAGWLGKGVCGGP